MTTISLNAPRNAREVKNLAWAQKVMESADSEIAKVKAQDSTKDDFIPAEGGVAVADLSLGGRTSISGTVHYDVDSGEVQSASLEKVRPVEVEVDHMMWGTYRGTTSLEVNKTPEKSSYSFQDNVEDKVKRDYNIVVDHQNQTLSFDFEQKKCPWVGRFRGL